MPTVCRRESEVQRAACGRDVGPVDSHFLMSIPDDVCTLGIKTTAVGDQSWAGQCELSDKTGASGEGHVGL